MDNDTKKFFEELAGIAGEPVRTKREPVSKHEEDPHTDGIEPPAEKRESAPSVMDEREGQLTIDVYQTAEAIIVESPIAGVRSDELEINVTSESVTIKGKRDREMTIQDEDYFYQECYWGRFSRSVILPQEIDPEKTEATVKNGVLTILMPKVVKTKHKKLKVRSG